VECPPSRPAGDGWNKRERGKTFKDRGGAPRVLSRKRGPGDERVPLRSLHKSS